MIRVEELGLRNWRRHLICLLSVFIFSSCFLNEPLPGNYYTFTGETLVDYVSSKSDLTKFNEILSRTRYYELLTTYGEYTCFAPTNAAIDTFLMERGLSAVSELSALSCDTLVQMHLVEGAFFLEDDFMDKLQIRNMLDRYLLYSFKPASGNGNNAISYYINYSSKLLHKNDTVVNGVVHTLNRVLDNVSAFLPQRMESDSAIRIFTAALKITGLSNKLQTYIDPSYSYDYSRVTASYSNIYSVVFTKTRFLRYTAFVESDSVYNSRGVYCLEDLIRKLKTKEIAVHDPNNKVTYTEDYSDTTNFLYRFVAYHLLDMKLEYERDLRKYQYYGLKVMDDTVTRFSYSKRIYTDPHYFFETMCPYTILKVQTAIDGSCYINRRRVVEGANSVFNPEDPYQVAVRGCRVYDPIEVDGKGQDALNGNYFYIDDLLLYDETTMDVLNARLRFDDWNLSPDFTNNDWNILGESSKHYSSVKENFVLTEFPLMSGFVKNFKFSNSTRLTNHNYSWQGWMTSWLVITTPFDVAIKLPPVPEGMYEIRIGGNPYSYPAQFYFDGIACGGLRTSGVSYKTMNERDIIPLMYVDNYQTWTILSENEETKILDKTMRNYGYMRGPDSWNFFTVPDGTLRESYFLRTIVTRAFLKESEVHYLRIKSQGSKGSVYHIDFLELCPESVYNNPNGEDAH